MKKFNKIFLSLALVLILAMPILTGCSLFSNPNNSTAKHTIYYTINDKRYQTYETSGNELLTLPTVDKTGYNFEGWYTDKSFTIEFTSETYVSKSLDSNVVIYGKLTPIEYTITYNLEEGSTNNSENPTTYNIETNTINLKNATKSGYKFMGWYTSQNGNGQKVTSIPQNSTGNKTLYSYFEKEYKITYYLDTADLTKIREINCTKSSYNKLYTPNLTDKSEYDFMGWYNTSDFAMEVTEISDDNANDIKLYAKWQKSIFTSQYGKIIGLTEYGQTLENIIIPTKIRRNGSEYDIYEIGYRAFEAQGFKTVTFEEGGKYDFYINDYAFYNCSELTKVTLSSNVKSTGKWMFASCKKLQSVEGLNNVEKLKYGTFGGCTGLQNIILGKNLATIDDNAFSDNVTIYYENSYINFNFNTTWTVYCYSSLYQNGYWHYDTDGKTAIMW